MANIAIFKAGKTPEYLISVNTGDYVVDPNVPKSQVQPKDQDTLINPDITAVKKVPLKYWKKVGSSIKEMTIAEKAAVDTQEKAQQISNIENYNFEGGILAKSLVQSGLVSEPVLLAKVKQLFGL